MKIGNPVDFFTQFDGKEMEEIQSRFGVIAGFLSPGDTFHFRCDRTGRCCKNRFENPIALSPYDIVRLRRRLRISSGELLQKYAELILGGESDMPIVLLEYTREGSRRNKCPFLRSYGCAVYADRPLRCRLYPLGRALDMKGVSYFFLMKTPDYCGVGKGKEYTLESWLSESEITPFLDWSDKIYRTAFLPNYAKYRRLDGMMKAAVGTFMYDCDGLIQAIKARGTLQEPKNDEEILEIASDALKKIFEYELWAQ